MKERCGSLERIFAARGLAFALTWRRADCYLYGAWCHGLIDEPIRLLVPKESYQLLALSERIKQWMPGADIRYEHQRVDTVVIKITYGIGIATRVDVCCEICFTDDIEATFQKRIAFAADNILMRAVEHVESVSDALCGRGRGCFELIRGGWLSLPRTRAFLDEVTTLEGAVAMVAAILAMRDRGWHITNCPNDLEHVCSCDVLGAPIAYENGAVRYRFGTVRLLDDSLKAIELDLSSIEVN